LFVGAVKSLEVALDRKVTNARHSLVLLLAFDQAKELEKLNGLAALPAIEVALADKYGGWDAAAGEFTLDKEGAPLDGKVCGVTLDGHMPDLGEWYCTALSPF
jgi:hypothetical protein